MKAFLAEEAPNMKIIPWPGNSPDLNPIENAWNHIKNKLQDMEVTSVDSLKEAIKQVWVRDLDVSYWRKLVESMPRRMELVIAAEGNTTKY